MTGSSRGTSLPISREIAQLLAPRDPEQMMTVAVISSLDTRDSTGAIPTREAQRARIEQALEDLLQDGEWRSEGPRGQFVLLLEGPEAPNHDRLKALGRSLNQHGDESPLRFGVRAGRADSDPAELLMEAEARWKRQGTTG
jgi:hypothetical protein